MEITIDGPVRTCVGCRQRAAKRELLRVTLGTDSEGHPAVLVDPSGVATGRGAHLHPTTACLELAERRRALPRALRHSGGAALSLAQVREHVEEMTVRSTKELEH